MKQFSIVAWTRYEVATTNPDVYLEPGINAVTVFVDSADELRKRLEALGVRIIQVNPIEVPPTPTAPTDKPLLEADGLPGTKSIS